MAGSLSVDSDYRYRGYSLSDGRPTATAQLSYDDPSGLYLNGAVTAVDESEGIDLQVYSANAGFSHRVTPAVSLDAGVVHTFDRYRYYFRGNDYVANATNTEVYVGANSGNLSARIYYSPHYFAAGVSTLYAEVEAGLQPARSLRLSAHIGGLTYLSAVDTPYLKHPSRYDWRLSASRQFGRFEIHSALSGGGPYLPYARIGRSGTALTVGASLNL